MSQIKLIIQSFLFYWKKNLVLAVGVAISTAVITGSLVVGDSVKSSLFNQVDLRLGKATHSLTAGDKYFTQDLAESIRSENDRPAAPVLLLRGIAVAGGGQQRVPGVQVLGVDENFDFFANRDSYYSDLGKGEVILSQKLADEIDASVDDNLLFRITKASLIPLNAPFVSDEETSIAVRVKVKALAGDEELGRFDLNNSQTSPLNAFFSIDYLNEVMDLDGRANLILINNHNDAGPLDLDEFIGGLVDLEDYGLDLEYLEHQDKWEMSSVRVFIEDQVKTSALKSGYSPENIFTYFVNSFTSNGAHSPYSFVSAIDELNLKDEEIMINSWLADDLDAGPGDSIRIDYFKVGLLRELENASKTFIIRDVYGMDSKLADSSLMPHLPGLSDAGSCSEWETGVPIDLEAIRDKDEDYWDKWKGTPKAIISMNTASRLWSNRFGESTAIRFNAVGSEGDSIESELLDNLSPLDMGFQITPSRMNGENAAGQGTDFGELFIGLSFFLLLAGIILSIVMFLLGVDSRGEQLGTFSILGFSKGRIRRIVLGEGLFAIITGLFLGLVLTVFYNKLIFSALNSMWNDIVRTDALQLYFDPVTLLTGVIISLLIILLSLYFSLNRYLRRRAVELHQKTVSHFSGRLRNILAALKWVLLLSGSGIIIFQLAGSSAEVPSLFFLAGGLLLLAFLLFAEGLLSTGKKSGYKNFNIRSLSVKNGTRNRIRSLSVIVLFALGVFLVVTTGANRKDPYSNAEDNSSGTGGFDYIVHTTVPVLHNLNLKDSRENFSLEGSYDFVQFRESRGDDASCLNLNRIQQPAVLGVRTGSLVGRFSFVTYTDELDLNDPWASLNQNLNEGVIPAIADQTIIQWGLGLKVGDTLVYQDETGREMRLLLIGGLANSIFQGNVLISDDNFLEHFPSSSGSSFLLLDNVSDGDAASDELSRSFRDYGWDMETTVQKLAEFNSIENTYLMIFMILGAFGLLLGTVGLGVILVRNLLERRQELALMKALGYGNGTILRIVLVEYMGLLLGGLLAGGISAIIAVLPGLLKPHSEVSFVFLILMLAVILINGIIWILGLAYTSIRKMDLVGALRNE